MQHVAVGMGPRRAFLGLWLCSDLTRLALTALREERNWRGCTVLLPQPFCATLLCCGRPSLQQTSGLDLTPAQAQKQVFSYPHHPATMSEKITDKINALPQDATYFSLEFFPPKTQQVPSPESAACSLSTDTTRVSPIFKLVSRAWHIPSDHSLSTSLGVPAVVLRQNP